MRDGGAAAMKEFDRLPAPYVTRTTPDHPSPQTYQAATTGSFAASLRVMADEAKAGIEQARADGRAQVAEAVARLNYAKAATARIAGTMARTILDEADAVMSDLGQVSNNPPE